MVEVHETFTVGLVILMIYPQGQEPEAVIGGLLVVLSVIGGT